MLQLSGLAAPIPTPFTDDGSQLSEIRLARLVHRLVAAGIRNAVVAGEMGEFTAIGMNERKTLLELVMRDAHNELSVVTNVSTLSTSATLDLAQHAGRHGARAVLLMPPYYGVITTPEVVNFFRTVVQYADIAVILFGLTEELKAEVQRTLADMPRLHFAEPIEGVSLSASAFKINDFECLPELVVSKQSRTAKHYLTLRAAMEQVGYAKAAKALLEEDECPQGTCRGPLQNLSIEQTRALAELLPAEIEA